MPSLKKYQKLNQWHCAFRDITIKANNTTPYTNTYYFIDHYKNHGHKRAAVSLYFESRARASMIIRATRNMLTRSRAQGCNLSPLLTLLNE